MTKLLSEAWAKLQELDESEQDRLAQMILDDIESERRWDELFATSQDVLEKLAREASEDYEAGRTDELIPEEL
jgi:hypothetical protein